MMTREIIVPSRSRFFFNDTATTEIYTLSLHDALPICIEFIQSHEDVVARIRELTAGRGVDVCLRSEEHTSELQSQFHLVCRLLLEKKKHIQYRHRRQFEPKKTHHRIR